MSLRAWSKLAALASLFIVHHADGGTDDPADSGSRTFAPAPGDIPSVFFIAKSQNKNQVHYGIRLDRSCRPSGERPVFAYWRMLENHGELEPLLPIETSAYGLLDEQPVEARAPGETTVNVGLRALADRRVTILVRRGAAGCEATATTTVGGMAARLRFAYVHVVWPFGIDYILLRGRRGDGAVPVEEIVRR
jgi:hypothetical protein